MFWQKDGIGFVCQNDHFKEKYQELRYQGFNRILFIRNGEAVDILFHLNLGQRIQEEDYLVVETHAYQPFQAELNHRGLFYDGNQILNIDKPICQECFKIGILAYVHQCVHVQEMQNMQLKYGIHPIFGTFLRGFRNISSLNKNFAIDDQLRVKNITTGKIHLPPQNYQRQFYVRGKQTLTLNLYDLFLLTFFGVQK
jgi:hypothetical protein